MVNPFDYDFIHLGISGGKDSTAVLLWLVYESGWPTDRIIMTNNDTNNEDPLTYAYLAMLTERVFPIGYVFPELDFWELARKKRRFPSRKVRFCTQHLKIIPSVEFISDLRKRGRVLLLTGVRREEGKSHNDRGDLEQFYYDDLYGCDKFLPVYEWALEDIWNCHRRHLSLDDVLFLIEDDPCLLPGHKRELIKRMRRHRIPRNPLYDMGARRVGCFPCINSAKLEVRAMAKYRPERVDFIETQENGIRRGDNKMFSSFFARNTVPEAHRSKVIITKDGKEMRVATIRDVIQWSQTAYGGKQFNMEFMAFDEQLVPCDMRGMCE